MVIAGSHEPCAGFRATALGDWISSIDDQSGSSSSPQMGGMFLFVLRRKAPLNAIEFACADRLDGDAWAAALRNVWPSAA